MVAVGSRFEEFPPKTFDYSIVLSALEAKALQSPLFRPMARLHPDRRASAAQMLLFHFNGRGLTTPQSDIPNLELDAEEGPQATPSPVTKVSIRPQASNDPDMPPQQTTAPARSLIVDHAGTPTQ